MPTSRSVNQLPVLDFRHRSVRFYITLVAVCLTIPKYSLLEKSWFLLSQLHVAMMNAIRIPYANFKHAMLDFSCFPKSCAILKPFQYSYSLGPRMRDIPCPNLIHTIAYEMQSSRSCILRNTTNTHTFSTGQVS